MTTAQRIITNNMGIDFRSSRALEAEISQLTRNSTAPNCFDRVWIFRDGSTITKTRDGYVAA
jgi:hypothetical protein